MSDHCGHDHHCHHHHHHHHYYGGGSGGSGGDGSGIIAIVSEVLGLVLATLVLTVLGIEVGDVPKLILIVLWQGLSIGVATLMFKMK